MQCADTGVHKREECATVCPHLFNVTFLNDVLCGHGNHIKILSSCMNVIDMYTYTGTNTQRCLLNILVGCCNNVSYTIATPHLLCERKAHDGKSGSGTVRSTAAIDSCTILSSEFRRGHLASM